MLERVQEDCGLFVGGRAGDGVGDGVDEFVLGALNGNYVGLVAVVAVVENGVADALLRMTGHVEGQAGNGRPPIPKGTQPEERNNIWKFGSLPHDAYDLCGNPGLVRNIPDGGRANPRAERDRSF